jgi:flavin-dependent dehydrogenase
MTSPYGLGALIERASFEQWLMSAARRAGVAVLQADRPLDTEMSNDRWHLADGSNMSLEPVTTPLIIQATGRGKGIVGPRKREHADRMVALLLYGDVPPGPNDQRLLIEASEHGWWYAAPLPDNRAVVSFMTDADLLAPTPKGRTDNFYAQLRATRLIATFAANLRARSPIVGFPASSGIREIIHGKGWIFIGDAAATYDPLSGRGVPVALAKGAAIARLVANNSDASRALRTYADAERATFADFLANQRRTYRRAAGRFNSPFWQRRCA